MDTVPKPTSDETARVAAFEAEFVAGLQSEDDLIVRDLLASGSPVYYIDDDTPAGVVIKEFPDGRRQYVSGAGRTEKVVHDL